MATLNWIGFKVTDVKAIVCNCGMVSRGLTQVADSITYSQRPCLRCVKDNDIAAVYPKEQFNALKAAEVLNALT
jgi:hypothetical protein